MSFDATEAFPLDDLAPRNAAVFLDFDGVLVDLAVTPDAVVVTKKLTSMLDSLERATGGACAIVSGRSVEDLRRHLPAAPRTVIGSHGAERDLPGAPTRHHAIIGSPKVARLHERAARAGDLDGVLVERKPTGVALHYRMNPDHGPAIRAFANTLMAEFSGFATLPAKAAIELRPADIGKDIAIAEAMALPDFAGRVPVYFGDDTTDEPALAWVTEQDGIAVKVGPGESIARHRLDQPSDVMAALTGWIESERGAR
ncbi:MAG: trehalose-phosphatase [Pseudomonadota bacterium]